MFIEHLSIIGVGLIGGSLARALREKKRVGRVSGCDRCETILKNAVDQSVIDDYSMDVGKAIKGADIVVMATPLLTMEKLMSQIVDKLETKTVLTDVGSVKGRVVGVARTTLGNAFSRFVPGHPIAGSEQDGVDAARADLFLKHRVVLTPTKETDDKAFRLVKQMWQSVGAEVVNLDVNYHDEILASTSHLPHVLAYALVDCLVNMSERNEIFNYAAGGFTDFSRIASSNPEMWRDICLTNREALLEVLDGFAKHIEQVKSSIERSDAENLLHIFSRAKKARDNFISQKQNGTPVKK